MIKYKAEWYSIPTIDKVEVKRETEKQIIISSKRRENKESDCYFYGNTYQEAREWLLNKALNKKSVAERKIEYCNDEINRLNKTFSLIYDFNEE